MLLRTLGELNLTGPTRAVLSSPRKELALLAYLCLHSARTLSRARLTELFWSDRDRGRARHSLRQALFELRQIVGTALEVTPDTVRLSADALELDASAFVEDVAAAGWSRRSTVGRATSWPASTIWAARRTAHGSKPNDRRCADNTPGRSSG